MEILKQMKRNSNRIHNNCFFCFLNNLMAAGRHGRVYIKLIQQQNMPMAFELLVNDS
jgi:hypothetical protein